MANIDSRLLNEVEEDRRQRDRLRTDDQVHEIGSVNSGLFNRLSEYPAEAA